jgi:hypothetical protein
LSSVLLAVAVLATVGVCEARPTPSPRAPDEHAILDQADAVVAAPSVAPAPPHALPPLGLPATFTPPAPIFAPFLASSRAATPSAKAPLYLRDRALLL